MIIHLAIASKALSKLSMHIIKLNGKNLLHRTTTP